MSQHPGALVNHMMPKNPKIENELQKRLKENDERYNVHKIHNDTATAWFMEFSIISCFYFLFSISIRQEFLTFLFHYNRISGVYFQNQVNGHPYKKMIGSGILDPQYTSTTSKIPDPI